MENLFRSEDSVDFWLWINPGDGLVRHQIAETGGFTSGGLIETQKSNLMFIPNPDARYELTPFQWGVMREYMAEYNLELGRLRAFNQYPSRLNSIYLFTSEAEAHKYKERHMSHVGARLLKRAHSAAVPCTYSIHDCGWVDFLRLLHSVDQESVNSICQAYWSGIPVQDRQLTSWGKPWTQEPILEVLFLGRIEFYFKSVEPDPSD